MLVGADQHAVTRGEALLAWYSEQHRDLPWRHTRDPYRILVSEVMLQQTQVSRVVPAYLAFLERFPTVESLAATPLREVLSAWQGLGYPVRARRLREAARMVTEEGWPRTARDLRRLPGVGPYTAAAVASFAFGEHVAVVDTNVKRVLSRWHGDPLGGTALDETADRAIAGDAATWNQAMMELGATVCRPAPACERCPVRSDCVDPSIYTPPPRQAPYEGSIRQVRGDLLRLLAGSAAPIPLEAVIEVMRVEATHLEAAVSGLVSDGLIAVDSNQVRLAG